MHISLLQKLSLLYCQEVEIYPSFLAHHMSPRVHTMFSSNTAQGILLSRCFLTSCIFFYAFLLLHVGSLCIVPRAFSFRHSTLILFKYCVYPSNYWFRIPLPKSNFIPFGFTSPHVWSSLTGLICCLVALESELMPYLLVYLSRPITFHLLLKWRIFTAVLI